jgi:hypothetical protein
MKSKQVRLSMMPCFLPTIPRTSPVSSRTTALHRRPVMTWPDSVLIRSVWVVQSRPARSIASAAVMAPVTSLPLPPIVKVMLIGVRPFRLAVFVGSTFDPTR